MAQSTVICEICDKREYEQICIDCDQYFCQECKEGHIKTKTTKDHTFHYSATFQPQYKKLRCRKHEQHFIFFCERCQTLVCPICLPENHQEHRMLKIDEVASIKKKELNQTIESFVTKLNEFEADVNRLQNITKKCTGENKDVIQHVDRQAKHISNVLENQRRCIIDDIKQKAKTETERISTIEGDLQHCLKAAKEMERKAKLYIHGSDTSLLSNFQLIKSEVDTFELQDTSISTCSVQFAKYNVPKEELSLLEGVFSGNLCGLSENIERNTLKNMMSNHDGKIKELQKELTNHIHIRNTMVEKNERMRSKIEALEQQKTEMKESLRIKIESKLQSKNTELEKLEHVNVTLKQKVEDLEKQIYRCKQVNNKIDKQFQSVCKERDELKNRVESIVPKFYQKEKDVEKMKNFLLEKEKEISKMHEDIDNRLSGVAGDKLTKGNPSFTDLGDPNSPIKISEKYGELYDNEWTDAMENVEVVKEYYHGLNVSEIEETVICHLHRLLKCCYKDCLAKTDEQMQTLGKALAETMCLTFNSEEVLSMPVCKEAWVFRRANSREYAKYLFENQILCRNVMNDWNYNYKNEKVMQLLMTSSFFEKCVYICWSMAIQDPVMYLDEDVPADTYIDKNTYKEFCKSGNTVAFVVWPALFLHKDGPLLYKGVVQAYRK